MMKSMRIEEEYQSSPLKVDKNIQTKVNKRPTTNVPALETIKKL